MKRIPACFLAVILLLIGCAATDTEAKHPMDGDGMMRLPYLSIDQTEALRMMKQEDDHVIVDVRRQEEYDAGHIPGAILIPNESIGSERPKELPDLGQVILIYCRSGNRSKQAAEKLGEMGYYRVYEFCGINTWPGEIVAGSAEATEPPEDDDAIVAALRPRATLVIEANGRTLYASLEDNPSADAFRAALNSGAIQVAMHDYGSFEKVGDLPWALPRNDEPITTVPGDVILYEGDKITLYYDENSWTFTRLARIDSATKEKLLEILGDGDVTVRFHLEWSE